MEKKQTKTVSQLSKYDTNLQWVDAIPQGQQFRVHVSLPFLKTRATCVNSPTFPKHEHREVLQVFHVVPVNQTLIRKRKKNNNTRLFGSSPWGLVAMYAVTQWPAPFIKSSCLGWVWANAVQYDSHYTPQWASCAPRLPLFLFWVQGFPTSSLVLSSALLSLALSLHPQLFSPLLLLPFQLLYKHFFGEHLAL